MRVVRNQFVNAASTSGTMPGVKPPTIKLETIMTAGAELRAGSRIAIASIRNATRSAGPNPARSARWPVSSGPTVAPMPYSTQ